MIKIIHGDLIKQCNEFDIILQGCNCFHTMGAGIARTIKNTWPTALKADKLSPFGDIDKLGNFSFLTVKSSVTEKELKVVNAYTQFQPCPPVDYIAIEQVMETLKLRSPGKKFGMPLIGCGLAMGDKNMILSIIEKELGDEDVTIIEFDPDYSGKDYSKDYTKVIRIDYIQRLE